MSWTGCGSRNYFRLDSAPKQTWKGIVCYWTVRSELRCLFSGNLLHQNQPTWNSCDLLPRREVWSRTSQGERGVIPGLLNCSMLYTAVGQSVTGSLQQPQSVLELKGKGLGCRSVSFCSVSLLVKVVSLWLGGAPERQWQGDGHWCWSDPSRGSDRCRWTR